MQTSKKAINSPDSFSTNVPIIVYFLNAYSNVYDKYLEQYPISWNTRKRRFRPMLSIRRCRAFCALMFFSLTFNGIPFAIVTRLQTQDLPDAQLWLFFANFLLIKAQGLLALVTLFYGEDI